MSGVGGLVLVGWDVVEPGIEWRWLCESTHSIVAYLCSGVLTLD